jgi:hypothetical protein
MNMNEETELADLLIKGVFEHKEDVFTFLTIGNMIQDVLNGFYKHRFTRLPYSSLSRLQCQKILEDTV